MVDPEHRMGGEHRVQHRVQFLGAGQVMPERLFDHHPPPGLVTTGVRRGRGRQPGALELLHHRRERLRRYRQIKRVVPPGAALGVQLGHRLGDGVECLVIGEVTGNEPDALHHLLPHRLAERRAGVGLDRVVGALGEVLMLPVPPGEAHQGKTRWQQPAVGQVIDRWQQLLGGQVPGHPEHHQHARPGDPRDAAVARVAQQIHAHWPPCLLIWSPMVSSSCAQESANLRTPSSSSTVTTSS